LIRLHFKGHAETGASGWTYGFVAVRNGTPRYGTLSQTTDTVLTPNGSRISAANADHNGGLAAAASTTFGFTGTAPGANTDPTPTCTAR
jgi:hypothetical protein